MHQQIPLASRKISVPSGTFLFMGVRYTNRAITTEQQIDILKERGLLIDDVERAVKALDIISYFRLAGYWRHFEADHTTHQFREGCRFADIIDLYSFDKQLRALLFTAIQTIEVAVRTKIIKHFALEFGAFWFMDENFATNEARFATNLAVIRKEVERSHDDFITEHSANTTNQSCLLYGKHWRLSQWEHSLSSIPIFQMPRQNMLSQESSV